MPSAREWVIHMGPVWLIKLRGAKGENLGLRVNFPSDPVVKNLPSNAWDTGSIAGQGTMILCPAGQLNLCATTAEPAYHNRRSLSTAAKTKGSQKF